MRKFLNILVTSFLMATKAWSVTDLDDRMDQLTEDLIRIASPNAGIGDSAQKLTSDFAGLDHEEVVAAMLPLLEHERKGVAELASHIILSCGDGVKVEHLSQLMEGYKNGGCWLPSTIGVIGTDEAIEFLAKEFRARPERGQIDQALVKLANRAVPFLLAEFDDASPHSENVFFEELRRVLRSMNGSPVNAVPHLIKVAESGEIEIARRKQAVLTIGHVGEASVPYFPRLRVLAQQHPKEFETVVIQSIIASGTRESAVLLADQVDAGAGYQAMSKIIDLRSAGKGIGPRAIKWLEMADLESRVFAVRLLGAIGYTESRTQLEELLLSTRDWRIAYAATKSLADIRAKESIPALEVAAKEYWLPVVRVAAENALRILRLPDESLNQSIRPREGFIDYLFISDEMVEASDQGLKVLSPKQQVIGKKMEMLVFRRQFPAFAQKLTEIWVDGQTKPPLDRGLVRVVPLGAGMLLGATNGDWAGGLFHVTREGEYKNLLTANIHGIERWQGRCFAAAGLNTTTLTRGVLYEVVQEARGLRLEPWFVLPGSPKQMWISRGGSLVVECEGGTIDFKSMVEFDYYTSGQNGSMNK